MPVLSNPHLALKFSQGLSRMVVFFWRLAFIMRIVSDGLCTCSSVNNRKWKTKNFSGTRTPTGSTVIIGLRFSGHEVVRNITSLYIIRQYYISFICVTCIKCDICAPNFLLKALIVKIVPHIGHDVLWFLDRGWKASMNKFYKKRYYFDELF